MRGSLIAIDPGFSLRGQGPAVALFRATGTLARVWYARPETVPRIELPIGGVTLVVWECPQIDARTRVSVPAVVQLAAVGGELAGLYAGACGAACERVTPLAWKGAVAKPVAHGRMWTALSTVERELLGGDEVEAAIEAAKRKGALDRWSKPGVRYYPGTWLTHNILDAVGIGLWRLGR